MECSINRPYISPTSLKEDLDEEVKWFESRLSLLLDKYAKILYVSPFSKRWWNDEVAEARKTWARAKRSYGRDDKYQDELKQARNTYYRVIRKAKRVCWQNFLQGQDTAQEARQSDDKNRCWTAFRYTRPQQFKTTPALKDTEGHVATSMKAKEALVCKSAFPSPPKSVHSEPIVMPGVAHQMVTKDIIVEERYDKLSDSLLD